MKYGLTFQVFLFKMRFENGARSTPVHHSLFIVPLENKGCFRHQIFHQLKKCKAKIISARLIVKNFFLYQKKHVKNCN